MARRSGSTNDFDLQWREVGTGKNLLTASRSCGRMSCGNRFDGVAATKLPVTVTGVPNNSSADEHPKSCFGAERIPSNTQGSASIQLEPVSRALREDFKCLWKRSTSPFA